MKAINYNNRWFRTAQNAANGDVGRDTVFHYRQHSNVVWATYEGGGVRLGTLVATVDHSGRLDMRYAHINAMGELMTGECRSTPEVLPDGRLRLYERWRWTCKDGSDGESVIEEITDDPLSP